MFLSHFAKLGSAFSAPAEPLAPPYPQLFAWNQDLGLELGLADISRETGTAWFSGRALPSNTTAVASAYAGHQFGHFVPTLGDGRAILIGELKSQSGELFEVQLKGAGPTEFSRRGDGLAALGPVIREYLLSEYMHTMKVPTTRALAACTTGGIVNRQVAHPGAVLTRVASSHIRIGTFEYHRHREDLESLNKLLRFCVDRHYPDLLNADRLAFRFFEQVSLRLSSLICEWIALGFIHGVLNTDNTSVAGITIDYGPCAFLDEYNSEKVFSSIDRQGRYRFSNQAKIFQWNLARLAECLIPLETHASAGSQAILVDQYSEVIRNFDSITKLKIQKRLLRKLGFDLGSAPALPNEVQLLEMWLGLLQEHSLDYTCAWKSLEGLLSGKPVESGLLPSDSEKFKSFLNDWKGKRPDPILLAENPFYIPRNHLVEKVIKEAETGDFTLFKKLQECLSEPMKRRDKWSDFEQPPKTTEIVSQTFCGT